MLTSTRVPKHALGVIKNSEVTITGFVLVMYCSCNCIKFVLMFLPYIGEEPVLVDWWFRKKCQCKLVVLIHPAHAQ